MDYTLWPDGTGAGDVAVQHATKPIAGRRYVAAARDVVGVLRQFRGD